MIQFEKLNFKIENVYLTSDTHYNHKNICKGTTSWKTGHNEQCRIFDTLENMNNNIVENINRIVGENDLLIHGGDWSFGGQEYITEFRNRIVCKNIILIQGNHDHHIKKVLKENPSLFIEFTQIGFYQIEYIKFVISHYPQAIWHQSHKDIPLFYGHVHGSFENKGKSLDIGIDNIFNLTSEYKPISLDLAYKLCMQKPTFLESHHNLKTN